MHTHNLHLLTYFWWPLLLPADWSYCLVSFPLAWKTARVFPCKSGLPAINSTHLCFSGNVFILLFFFFRLISLGYRILGCLFSFSTLNMSFFFLVASTVSYEKLTINHIVVPFYTMSCFSLAAFGIFSFLWLSGIWI